MRALIIASGGGHTGHAMALAERLVDLGVTVDFVIPEGDRWSEEQVSRLGRVVARTPKFLDPGEGLAKGVLRLPGALLKSLARVPGGYDVAVASGSNHSIASGIAARLKGAKLVTIEATERFVEPSRAVRALSPISRLVALQWEEQRRFAPRGVVVGPLLGKLHYRVRDEGYILVTAGSYGYRALFDAAAASGIRDRLVLQTGRVDPGPYVKAGLRAFSFSPELEDMIAGASAVVTHFGRTAVEAACKYGKPTVLAPNTEWVWMRSPVRMVEASMMAKRIGAVLLPPDQVTPEGVERAVEEAMKARPAACDDGSVKLAQIITSWRR
ncbi:UDP-N-acetylglucosamine--N-acetylmuramyl-(pentapeptide) pyrophosphoryl-undecaprenol N-acetylglucosamine transferase [Acidilobus sp.]|uniref:UDP-N-acetylglucosamine--N-acetylmuramyl- (pentapeptide) pyrophosphoryl-undecaprenol N-acetylglucosamine transferase n=1 Tax=Acidilobus sp. TaxID=1872109 RepID=UPI003D063C7B